jgi:hypothetical protein
LTFNVQEAEQRLRFERTVGIKCKG